MALKRRNGRLYYYRNRRIGRRVVSEYVGAGAMAEMEHTLQRVAQLERQEERDVLTALQSQLADPPELTEYLALVRLLTQSTLVAAGFRQHKRGEWRRPRG